MRDASLQFLQNLISPSTPLPPYPHSAFFKAQMQYYKLIGPADAFYKNCLMFLSYTNCASQANGGSLKDSERVVIARDISLAAISGEGIFNFGEGERASEAKRASFEEDENTRHN